MEQANSLHSISRDLHFDWVTQVKWKLEELCVTMIKFFRFDETYAGYVINNADGCYLINGRGGLGERIQLKKTNERMYHE